MPTMHTNGTEVYYEEFGEGRPIVFTNPGNATLATWGYQVATFAPSNHVVTYDWRGTGRSGRPRSGYSGEAAADDLAALVELTCDQPAVLVGHGMGAHVSLLAELRHANLVAGLMLLDGAPWYSGVHDGVDAGMPAEFLALAPTESGMSYPDMLDQMVTQWLFKSPPSEALRRALVQDGLNWPMYVLDEYDRTMIELDHRTTLGDVTVPTVVIHGRHDRKQRYEGGVYLADKIPGAELVTLEDSAHMGHLEQPEEFNESLRRLVARI